MQSDNEQENAMQENAMQETPTGKLTVKHLMDGKYTLPDDTEILIIGTWLPQYENFDFFYGSPNNDLWKFLPQVFGEETLKGKSREEKENFCAKHKIGFVDIVAQIEGYPKQVKTSKDKELFKLVKEFNNVVNIIDNSNIKSALVTRKSKNAQLEEIEIYCQKHNMTLSYLYSPSGRSTVPDDKKLLQWKNEFKRQNII